MDSQLYRRVIDDLVRACHEGQGQISARRVRSGTWNKNASADQMPDQHEINLLLSRLSVADREIVAHMLAQSFEGGVFETLVTLNAAQIAPFDKAYEGFPHEDFVGRLADWQWPTAREPS